MDFVGAVEEGDGLDVAGGLDEHCSNRFEIGILEFSRLGTDGLRPARFSHRSMSQRSKPI